MPLAARPVLDAPDERGADAFAAEARAHVQAQQAQRAGQIVPASPDADADAARELTLQLRHEHLAVAHGVLLPSLARVSGTRVGREGVG